MVNKKTDKPRVAVYRKAHFNAAHRLYRKDWNDEKNNSVFGLCANPHYHGHNYEITVKVVGEVDPETGFVIDLNWLKTIIYEEVELPFDHKNLNLEVPVFSELNPTAENICIEIYQRLRRLIDPKLGLQVRLYETPRNFAEYPVEI